MRKYFYPLLNPIVLLGIIWLFSVSNLEAQVQGYQYYRDFTFRNVAAQATPANYQVGFAVDLQALINAGKLRTDRADIRLTTPGSCQPALPHWIEDSISSFNAPPPGNFNGWGIVWTKLTAPLAPNATITIRMNYGNPTATSVEDGNLVFDFFDDFSAAISPAKWTACANGINWGQTATVNGMNRGYARMTNAPNGDIGMLNSTTFTGSNYVVESDFYYFRNSCGGCWTHGSGISLFRQANFNHNLCWGPWYGNRYNIGNSSASCQGLFGNVLANSSCPGNACHNFPSWYKYSARTNNNAINFRVLVGTNAPISLNANSNFTTGGVGLGGFQDSYFDWFRVRKNFTPEPTLNQGAEFENIVTIIPNPPPPRCSNDPPTRLTATYPDNSATFTWNPGNLLGPIQDLSPNTTTTYTVVASTGGGCGGSATVTVTVLPAPVLAPTANPNTPVCPGQTVTLNAGGNANNYTWQPGNLTGQIVTVNPLVTTTYTVSGPGANGCIGTGTVTVTVFNSNVNVQIAPVNPSRCSADLPTVLTASGASTYRWSSGQNTASISESPVTTTTYTVTGTDANGCTGSASVTLTVTTTPAQPGNVTGATQVCVGPANIRYSVPFAPGVNFTWTTTASGITITPVSPSGNSVDVVFNPGPGGPYPALIDFTITPTSGGCVGPVRNHTVTLITNPAQPGIISGSTSFCPNSSGNSYSIASVPTATTYLWSITPGTNNVNWRLGPQGTVNQTIDWLTPGTYNLCVIANNSCGNSVNRCLSVTVNPNPAAPTASNITNPVCPNQQNTAYSVNDVSGTTYNWVVPNGATVASGQGTSSVTVNWGNMTPGLYTLRVTPTRLGCVGATLNIPVLVNDPPPPATSAIQGLNPVCQGAVETYQVGLLPTATNYQWSVSPNGPTIAGQGTNIISINWGNSPRGNYTVSVVPSNSCGSGPATTLTVMLESIPVQPSGISGPPYHCLNTQRTYSIQPIANATSYTWTNSCGWSGLSTGTSITYTATTLGPCVISVTANNFCGNSLAATLTVSPIDVPSQPSTVSGLGLVCVGQVEQYSVVSVAGVSYNWSGLPNGATVTQGQGTNNVTIDWGAAAPGNYTLRVTPSNVCGNGLDQTLSVTIRTVPNQPQGLSGPSSVCEDVVSTYSVTNVLGVSYTWSISPSGPLLTPSGSSAIVAWNNRPGVYVITVIPSNACGNGVGSSITVRVSDKPSVSAGMDMTVCGPNAVLVGSPVGGVWSCQVCPPPAVIVTAGPFGIITGMSPAVHVFKYSVMDPVCGMVEDFVTVTNDQPIPGFVTSDATVCGGENGTLQLIGYTPGARIVRWERSTDNFVSSASPINNTSDTYTYTNITETTQFRAVLVMTGLCAPIHSSHATITVRPNESAQVSSTLVTVCKLEAIVNAVLPQSGMGMWSFVNGPGGAQIVTSGSQGIISGMNVSGDYIFRWTVSNPPCAPNTRDVVVRRLESVPSANAGANQRVCGTSATLVGNLPPNVSGLWSFVTGPAPAVVVTAGQTGLVSGMSVAGDYVFRWTLSNVTCNQSTQGDVVVSVFDVPTPAIAGQNQQVCGPIATVHGNEALNGVGRWSFVSGPSGATPSISTSGSIGTILNMSVTGDYVFRWTIDNGVCPPSSSDVTITRVDAASSASVPQSVYNICDIDNLTLLADPALGGTGVWEYIQGPVQANVTTNGSQGLATGLTAEGTYKFRWRVTNGCGTSEVQVLVNKGKTFSPPPFAGSNQRLCEQANALLIGSIVPPGYTGLWRFISGPRVASVATFGNFGSVVNMDLDGPYVFSWEISNGGVCPVQYSQVTITRVKTPTPADAGSNQTICGTSTTLQGNVPTSGEGSWSFVSGPTSANVSFTNNVASVSNMNLAGEYVFRYTISNLPCPSSTSDVRVQVNPGTNAGSLSGGGTVCSGNNSGTLNLSGYQGTIVRWESSVDNFVSMTPLNNLTSLQSYSNLTRTTWYRVVVKQGGCGEQVSNVVKITVTPAAVQSNAGANQTVCGTSVNLQGNDPQGQTAVWSQVSGPNASLSQIGRLAVVSGMVSGVYVFSYTITSGNCGGSVSNVIVTVTEPSVGGSVSSPMTVCGDQNMGTLLLTGYTGSIVRWESSEDNFGTVITYNNTDSEFMFMNLSATTQYRAIVKNGTCPESPSSAATVTVLLGGVQADAGQDQVICGNQSILMGSDPGVNGSGVWSFMSSDNNITPTVLQSGMNANILGMTQAGSYTFKYSVTNPACGTSFDEVTIVRSEGSIGGGVSTDYTVCSGTNQGTLQLGGYTGSIVRWEQSTNNWLTWVNINNTTPVIDFLNLTETTQFRGVVRSEGCSEAKSFHATVYVLDAVPVADGGLDQTICGSGTSLSGNYDQGVWSYVSGPSSPVLTQASGIAQANNLVPGTYLFEFTIDNGACGATSDVVSVLVQPSLATGAVSFDQTVCGQSNSGTLTLSGHNGMVLGWESSTDGFVSDINYENNVNTIQSFTNLTATTYFRAKVGLSGCGTGYSSWAKITVSGATDVAQSGFNQELCGNSVTLTGNLPVHGIGVWSIVSVPNGANPSLTQSQNLASITGMTLSGAYRFRYTINNAPCNSTSSEVVVTVSVPSVGGQLTTNSPDVCMGSNSGVIILSGHTGDVIRWESSVDNFATSTTLSNTLTTLNFTNLSQTTSYRSYVGNGSCAPMYSSPVTIRVNPMTVGGMVSMDQTVCAGSNSGNLMLQNYTGTVIRWEFSTDGFVTVVSVLNNNPMYSFTNLTQTTQYRAVVQSAGCMEQNSLPATVFTTNGSVGGVISGAVPVCSGSNSGMLILSNHVGNVLEWESSESLSFIPSVILPNTMVNQGFNNLTRTTYYRAKVGSGNCSAVYSSIARVDVNDLSVGGMVTSNQTVCSGINSGVLVLSGHLGTVVRWERSADNQSWLPVSNTMTTWTFNNLSQTTWYRAVVKNGVCLEVPSMGAKVEVSPVSAGGMLSGSATVCANANSGLLTLNGHVGSVIRWESSTDCSGFSNLMVHAVQLPVYSYSNLSQTTCYRAIVKSGSCPESQSNVVRIETTPGSQAGVILGGTSVCGTNASGTLTLSGFDGSILRWEQSTDGVNWVSINNVSPNLSYSNLTGDTWYRAVVRRGNCPEAISSPALIMVSPPSVGGNLSGSVSGLCNGSNSGLLSLIGHVGTVVRWEMSVNNGPFTVVPGAQGTSYSYSNLTATTSYRVVVKSGICSEAFSNVVVVGVSSPLLVSAGSVTGCNLTGNITAVAQGGGGGYVYSISPQVSPDNSNGNFLGIDPGVYTVTVRDAGGCTASSVVTVSSTITPTQIVAVTNITPSSALVQWAVVPPGAGVNYNLRYRVLGDNIWTLVSNITSNSRFVSGLQNNTTYEIEVQYVCPNNGPVSGFSTGLINQFTTLFQGTGDCLTSGSNNVPVPGGIYVNSISSTSAVVHWNLVPNAAGYIISFGLLSQNVNGWTQVVVCNPSDFFTMTNLVPNAQYGVRVRTNCSNCTTALNNLDKRSVYSTVFNYRTLSSREALSSANDVNSLVVYPNPNKGNFAVNFVSGESQEVRVRLLDVTGREVLNRTYSAVTGDNSIPVELLNYTSGMYLLQVEVGSEVKTVKVIID